MPDRSDPGENKVHPSNPAQVYGLEIAQPREGYRYSVDSILLAQFARGRPRARILDIGAGCGIISLILARRFPACTIHALEIQEELFTFLERNILTNEFQGRIIPLHDDIRRYKKFLRPGSFELVVSNPPFRSPCAGRLCLNAGEALARHEILMDLQALLESASWALVPGGRFYIIYPAERLSFLLNNMTDYRIEPKRLRCVHPSADSQARMVLVEGIKDAGIELRIEQPLILDKQS